MVFNGKPETIHADMISRTEPFVLLCTLCVIFLLKTSDGFRLEAASSHRLNKKTRRAAAEAFGDCVDIKIRLPTRDKSEAEGFLDDVDRVIKSSWQGRKYTFLGDERYNLILGVPLPPGLGTLESSIVVEFKKKAEQKGIFMTSYEKMLKGKGPIMNDNGFADSFDLSFKGFIRPEQGDAKIWYYVGQVEYKVFGEIPLPLQIAPPQLLRGAIDVIKGAIKTYAINEVTTNINKEFKSYVTQQRINESE